MRSVLRSGGSFYTTNAVEALNSKLRRAVRTLSQLHASLPTKLSLKNLRTASGLVGLGSGWAAIQ